MRTWLVWGMWGVLIGVLLGVLVGGCAAKTGQGVPPRVPIPAPPFVVTGPTPMAVTPAVAPLAPGLDYLPIAANLYLLPATATSPQAPAAAGPFSVPISNGATNCRKPSLTSLGFSDATKDPQFWSISDPYHPGEFCEFTFPTNTGLNGSYKATVSFYGDCSTSPPAVTLCESPRAMLAPVAFTLGTGAPNCAATGGKQPADLRVGEWTRSGAPKDSGRVLFSLTFSRDPVVRVTTTMAGVEQGRLEGSDLRVAAGTYFTLPALPGSYTLVVSAQTATGCTDGDARPMTVVVQ